MKHCNGVPLVLTVAAKSLQGMDRSFWERDLLELSESTNIQDCLKMSLDEWAGVLPIKKSFMDLASFPEDSMIHISTLIDMWVELYRLDFDGIQALFGLQELVSRGLVDLLVSRYGSEVRFVLSFQLFLFSSALSVPHQILVGM